MSRLIVSVPLLENARERALHLLSEGPPSNSQRPRSTVTTPITPTGRRSSSSRAPGEQRSSFPGEDPPSGARGGLERLPRREAPSRENGVFLGAHVGAG
jgi:hypothetical protein